MLPDSVRFALTSPVSDCFGFLVKRTLAGCPNCDKVQRYTHLIVQRMTSLLSGCRGCPQTLQGLLHIIGSSAAEGTVSLTRCLNRTIRVKRLLVTAIRRYSLRCTCNVAICRHETRRILVQQLAGSGIQRLCIPGRECPGSITRTGHSDLLASRVGPESP